MNGNNIEEKECKGQPEPKSGMVVDICNPVLRKLRQEDWKFKTHLGYIAKTLSLKQISKYSLRSPGVPSVNNEKD